MVAETAGGERADVATALTPPLAPVGCPLPPEMVAVALLGETELPPVIVTPRHALGPKVWKGQAFLEYARRVRESERAAKA